MLRRLLGALFGWAGRRRDAAVSAALDEPHERVDHDLARLLRESGD